MRYQARARCRQRYAGQYVQRGASIIHRRERSGIVLDGLRGRPSGVRVTENGRGGNLSLLTSSFTAVSSTVGSTKVKKSLWDANFWISIDADALTRYAPEQNCRAVVAELLRAVLTCGQLGKEILPSSSEVAPNTARAVIKALTENGILGSESQSDYRVTVFEPYPCACCFRTLLEKASQSGLERPNAYLQA